MLKPDKKFKTITPDGESVELLCVRPNQDVIDGARREYNVKFAQALREGGLTRAEAEDIIEKRKLWSNKHEEKLQNYRKVIRDNEVALIKCKDAIKGKEIAITINKLRDEMSKLIGNRNEILNRTCEAYAEGAQNQYLLVRCILRPDDRQPYFESVEAFKVLENSQLIIDALAELLLFLHDTTVEELTNTPENKWLVDKKLKCPKTGFWIKGENLYTDDNRRVNAQGEYLDEVTGERVDYWGYPLNLDESLNAKENNETAQDKDNGVGTDSTK